MARKAKPRSPEAIAAERIMKRAMDFAAANLPADSAALATFHDIEVRRKGQKHELTARRSDAFDALRSGMAPGAYDAARRLERDILVSLGQHDHGRHPDRVDCEQAAFSRVDIICAASERVRRIRDLMFEREFWLLSELIWPAREHQTWRGAVAYVTGETHAHGQGAVVRAACVNLRDAYERLSRRAA
jgi:hypothetical protein